MSGAVNATATIESGHEQRAFWRLGIAARMEVGAFIVAQALAHGAVQRGATASVLEAGATLAAWVRRSPLRPRPTSVLVERNTLASALNPFPKECVAESLILWTALRANDHPAQLWTGCRTVTGRFEAHAWVELDGCVLHDPDRDAGTWTKFDRPLADGQR